MKLNSHIRHTVKLAQTFNEWNYWWANINKLRLVYLENNAWVLHYNRRRQNVTTFSESPELLKRFASLVFCHTHIKIFQTLRNISQWEIRYKKKKGKCLQQLIHYNWLIHLKIQCWIIRKLDNRPCVMKRALSFKNCCPGHAAIFSSVSACKLHKYKQKDVDYAHIHVNPARPCLTCMPKKLEHFLRFTCIQKRAFQINSELQLCTNKITFSLWKPSP